MEPRQRLVIALVSILLVIAVGTIGLMVLDNWPAFDALYMVVITIATVGYGEVRPLSPVGRAFVMVLILVGVGTVFYSLTSVAEVLIEHQIAPGKVLRRRMRQQVRKMRNHVIVCGYGRVGTQVAGELAREGVPVVVVDLAAEVVERCGAAGHACVQGDAADDDCLREAGIEQARGLVVTTNSDANNVYVTLAARSLRPDLYIVARLDADEAAPKLTKAGANRVISPYHLGGRRMASLVLRPAAVDFIDTALRSQQGTLQLEEVQVQEGAPLAGQTLSVLRRQVGAEAAVLAVIKSSGNALANPPATTTIMPGDVLIVLGSLEDLRVLELQCGRPGARATGPVEREAGR